MIWRRKLLTLWSAEGIDALVEALAVAVAVVDALLVALLVALLCALVVALLGAKAGALSLGVFIATDFRGWRSFEFAKAVTNGHAFGHFACTVRWAAAFKRLRESAFKKANVMRGTLSCVMCCCHLFRKPWPCLAW